ncbi:MAG: hypothetical protein F7C32_03025 [Desulfurococcales archaeon]|nr:hypothetical protein [Desulfurococcales archaeon]
MELITGCLTLELLLNEPEGNANLAVLTRKRCIETERKTVISTLHVSAIDYESLPSDSRAGLIGALHIPVALLGPINILQKPHFIPLALLSPMNPEKVKNCIERLNKLSLKEKIFSFQQKDFATERPIILFHNRKLSPCHSQNNFHTLTIMTSIALGLKPDLPIIKTTPDGCILEYNEPGLPWYFNPTIWDIHRIICGEPESGCLKKKWPLLLIALGLLSTCELLH